MLDGFVRVLRPGGPLGLVTSVGDGPELEPVEYAAGVRRWFVHRDPDDLAIAATRSPA